MTPRILVVHNAYGAFSGEERAVSNQVDLLRSRGHAVEVFSRSSEGLSSLRSQAAAFASGLYSFSCRRDFVNLLRDFRPHVVHVHNLFPLISGSILLAAAACMIPVVMTLHNFRLICPTGLLNRRGTPCHACVPNRDYWCAVTNCTESLPKSVGYALRNTLTRKLGAYDAVRRFICLSRFQTTTLAAQRGLADKMTVLPNFVGPEFAPGVEGTGSMRSYVAFAGRRGGGKGLEVLERAARMLPHIEFRVAGAATSSGADGSVADNVRYLGPVPARMMPAFYNGARLVAVPSTCYEGLPFAAIEGLASGRPLIASNLGALPEIVTPETGQLVEPGNPVELADAIRTLWNDEDRCAAMERAAATLGATRYSAQAHYVGLSAVYEGVIRLNVHG